MLKHASKRSIFFRYIVSFLVPVSMTVFLTLLSMWYLNNFVKDKNTKVFENVSQQINNELNDIFKEIDQVMISYATDLNFYKRLGSILGKYKLTYDELQTLRFCQNTIDISANIHPYIDSIYCIPYATQAQLNMLVSYDGTYVVENHSDATFIKNVINNQDDEGIVIRSISGGMLPEKRLISKYIKIQSIDGRRHKGLIIVNLDVKHIESVLNIHKQDQDKLFFITFKNQEMPVFYSSELKLIESSSLQEIVMDIENGRTVKIPLTDSITHSQRQTVVKYIPLDAISNEYGFRVYLMISKNALYSTSENLITMNIIVITVSIILGILIILLITHRKYSEIIKIDNYIDMLDNTPVFSIASEKNRKNIADYIKLHISERELNERKMEIQILRSQLNPHFLLNTLQMLNWSIMRELKGYSEINKIIGALCKILSHSLYHGDSLSKLDEEIRYTNSYTTLQGYTKKTDIKIKWEVSESMKQYMVPRMLFQPIIENAYKHAFKDKHSDYLDPQITVLFEQKYGDLYIYITDNGNGMESETLKKIRKSLNHEPISDSGIGLSNTNRRIKLLFGQKFGISINSKVGKGTEVLMLIPIIIESFKGKPSSKSNYQ